MPVGVHIPVPQLFPSNSRSGPERPLQDADRAAPNKARTDNSSLSNEHRYAGPSRINWICNTSGAPSPTEMPRQPPFAHILGRSVSSPSPLYDRASTSPYAHPMISSNHSLQLDAAANRHASDIEGNLTLLHIKPLSPIMERSHTSADRWMSSMEDSSSTPGTPASFDIGDHGSTYSAFLKRPLKRSISQASSSSLRTMGTMSQPIAPTLPPLDLRPPFGMAHRAGPQLFSTVYEDAASERTGSFVTARTDPDGADAEEDITHASQTQVDESETTRVPSHLIAPALAETTDTSARRANPSLSHELTHNPEPFLTDPDAPPVPRIERSSDFIMERWRRSLSSYDSTRPSFTLLLAASAWRIRPHLPQVLFWAGFLAPWCWLLGGWLIEEARFPTVRHKGAILPRWRTSKGTVEGKTNGEALKDTGQGRAVGSPRLGRWCVRWDALAGSVTAAETQRPAADKETIVVIETGGTRTKNIAWVVRCRIAAVVSGLLLAIAFIVGLVMVRGR